MIFNIDLKKDKYFLYIENISFLFIINKFKIIERYLFLWNEIYLILIKLIQNIY